MTSVLEDFPNELLLFILRHLSVVDFLWSFYRLNRRFSSLIQTIPHLYVDFSSQALSKTQFIHIINHLRSMNIESIRISTRHYVDPIPLITSYIPPNQLLHLRSLALIDVDRNTIDKFVHNHPKSLTSLSIESVVWRSIPDRFLPTFPHLTHCHLPTLNFLNGCHSELIHLDLDHCTTDTLTQLNTFAPNLRSLTLTLISTTDIPLIFEFPSQLTSLKLTLRSVLFTEFERLMTMIDHIENLTVSFSNTEHEVYSFDQYLSGENWLAIKEHVYNLRFNITVYHTLETFLIADLVSAFDWFPKRVHCQSIDGTNSYQLFSLPYIDQVYIQNSMAEQKEETNSNDFSRVRHLHLTFSNENIPRTSNNVYLNLQKLTVITPSINDVMLPVIDNLLTSPRLRTLEIRLTSAFEKSQEYFEKLLSHLPLTIETLILNTKSTQCFSEALDKNDQFLPTIKRLLCSIKTRDQFDALLLLLVERFEGKSLIYLNISVETSDRSSNLLSGWILKTSYFSKARIKCSDRQCAIWI